MIPVNQVGVTKSAAADGSNHALVFAANELASPAAGRSYFMVVFSGTGTAFVSLKGAATSADSPIPAGHTLLLGVPVDFSGGGTVNVNSGDTPTGNIYVCPVAGGLV